MNKKSLSTEGNMYMVNLNHIEGAESKEGYESEARCSDNESGTDMQSLTCSHSIRSTLSVYYVYMNVKKIHWVSMSIHEL